MLGQAENQAFDWLAERWPLIQMGYTDKCLLLAECGHELEEIAVSMFEYRMEYGETEFRLMPGYNNLVADQHDWQTKRKLVQVLL